MMKISDWKHKSMLFSLVSLLMVTALNIAGCGGGNGAPPASTSIKGLWAGTQGSTETSAIILSNGDSWLVFQESGVATKFARMQTTTNGTSFSSSGYQYLLQSGVTEAASASGNFVEKASITATSGGNSLNLSYNSQYEVPASSNDAAGSWKGTYGGGASSLNLTVSSVGVLSGSSSTGCTYSGSLQPRSADPAVFDIRFNETCVTGATTSLEGIATFNTLKTGISFAVTTSDKSRGALFAGIRQ